MKVPQNKQNYYFIDRLIIEIYLTYGINLLSRSRKKEFIKKKHTLIYLLYKEYRYNNINLAHYFNMDHSSISHILNKVEFEYEHYDDIPYIYEEYNRIAEPIYYELLSRSKNVHKDINLLSSFSNI